MCLIPRISKESKNFQKPVDSLEGLKNSKTPFRSIFSMSNPVQAALAKHHKQGCLNNRYVFLRVGRLKCEIRCPYGWCLGRTLTGRSFLLRLLIPSWRLHLHVLITFQRPHPWITSYWRVGFPHTNLRRHVCAAHNSQHQWLLFSDNLCFQLPFFSRTPPLL